MYDKIESGATINIHRDAKPKEKQERFVLSQSSYSLNDIVLQEQQESAIREVLALSKYDNQIFHTWGLGKVIKRGRGLKVNLYGVPGTGKTMAAHAIAMELEKPILEVNYAEIESKFVGETSKNLVELFHTAENERAVLLFDEADALLSKRVTEMHSSSDVSVNQTRSVLLKILDEYSGICLFTTNFIRNYDPAFMRRITRHIYFGLPNFEQRKRLWQHYLVADLPHNANIDELSEKLIDVSGADIANAVLNAAIKAASEHLNIIPQDYFEFAVDEIVSARKDNQSDESAINREITEA